MASAQELAALFNDGELGKLLVARFGGELGHLNLNKDSDFLLVFKDKGEVPEEEAIVAAVRQHYGGLGYMVELRGSVKACTLVVRYENQSELCLVNIAITTHYPFNGGHACLRATCTITA